MASVNTALSQPPQGVMNTDGAMRIMASVNTALSQPPQGVMNTDGAMRVSYSCTVVIILATSRRTLALVFHLMWSPTVLHGSMWCFLFCCGVGAARGEALSF
ncbi:hypothetical protein J6590_039763 [Homalodisca vitripennis]|nr:hypothetical protein J6590_039763 [Homalodisca vitripennis]